MADPDLDRGREPVPGSSRPTTEMPSHPSSHGGHDVLILAAAADHDPEPETLALVERMTRECTECAAIAADLRSLARGLAELPPEAPAPRDFRITDVQAARLRRGGFLRRLLEPFGVDGLPGLKPLANALTVVGLAGILLTNLPVSLLPGAGSAAAPLDQDRSTAGGAYEAPASAAPEAVTAPSGGNAGPGVKNGSPAPSADVVAPPQASGGDTSGRTSAAPLAPGDAGANGGIGAVHGTPPAPDLPAIPPVTLASIVVLLAGVMLLSLRLVARRID